MEHDDRDRQELDFEAAQWLTRLEDIERKPEAREQREWFEWLQRSPAHVQAYFDLATASQSVDEVSPEGRQRIRAMLAAHRHARIHEPKSWRARWNTTATHLAVAAGVAGIGIGLLWFDGAGTRYTTKVGDRHTYRLSDGSTMMLNTRSKARVKMNQDKRSIELEGEGFFTVAPDAHRPFEVRTRSATALALGTAFNIYERIDGSTTVAVVDGAVRVTPGAAAMDPAFHARVVSAGQAVDVVNRTVRDTATPNITDAISWQKGILVFQDATLSDVAVEFNRYTDKRFSIEPAVGLAHRLSGTFDARHPEDFKAYLERDESLAVVERGSTIAVRARAPH